MPQEDVSPVAVAEPSRRERQSYLGRDLSTGHLVGRETFMGKPLTPALHRIPAEMRRAVEQRNATAIGSVTFDSRFGGVPTAAKVQMVQEQTKLAAAEAETKEEKERIATQAERDLSRIREGVVSAVGSVLSQAVRGDTIAAQYAPRLRELDGDYQEVRSKIAEIEAAGGSDQDIADFEEERDAIVEEMDSIISDGVLKEQIERTQNAPSEQERFEQEQFEVTLQEDRFALQQRRTAKAEQDQAKLAEDIAAVTKREQSQLEKIEVDVSQISDANNDGRIGDEADMEIIRKRMEDDIRRRHAEERQAIITRHTREQRIFDEIAEFQEMNLIQSKILTAKNPAVLRSLVDAMYTPEGVEALGGFDATIDHVRDRVREYASEQKRRRRTTGFHHHTAGTLSLGDVIFLMETDDQFNQTFAEQGLDTPEKISVALEQAQRAAPNNAGAKAITDYVNSIRIDAVHDYDAVRYVMPEMRNIIN